jgi:Bromodomain
MTGKAAEGSVNFHKVPGDRDGLSARQALGAIQSTAVARQGRDALDLCARDTPDTPRAGQKCSLMAIAQTPDTETTRHASGICEGVGQQMPPAASTSLQPAAPNGVLTEKEGNGLPENSTTQNVAGQKAVEALETREAGKASPPGAEGVSFSPAGQPSSSHDPLQFLEGLLAKLATLDSNGFFEDPVVDAPGYHQVIQRPMCFSKMRTLLREGQYRTWRR